MSYRPEWNEKEGAKEGRAYSLGPRGARRRILASAATVLAVTGGAAASSAPPPQRRSPVRQRATPPIARTPLLHCFSRADFSVAAERTDRTPAGLQRRVATLLRLMLQLFRSASCRPTTRC